MKEEKYFFGKLTRKVPQTAWEADYLNKLELSEKIYSILFLGIILTAVYALLVLVFIQGHVLCSAEFELEGKGAIELTKNKLIDTPLKNFELNEGKIKVSATVPCYLLSSFNRNWGN